MRLVGKIVAEREVGEGLVHGVSPTTAGGRHSRQRSARTGNVAMALVADRAMDDNRRAIHATAATAHRLASTARSLA